MTRPDIFQPHAERAAELLQQRQDAIIRRRGAIQAAFATGPGAVAYLRECLAHANAQPSYHPGVQDPHHVAYNEGKRAALRELVGVIDDAFNPSPSAAA